MHQRSPAFLARLVLQMAPDHSSRGRLVLPCLEVHCLGRTDAQNDPQRRANWLAEASLVSTRLDEMLKELTGLPQARRVVDAHTTVTKLKKTIASQVNSLLST